MISLSSFIFLFILYFSHVLSSQSSHPGFRHFTADDGLPSSEVYEILQDRQGYIWFCTDNGVSRYNGYKFENYGAKQGLTEPVVFHMVEDSKGRIWMQSMSGRIFYFEKDSIYPFAGNKLVNELKNKQHFGKGLLIDSTGNVYSSISPMGLFKFFSCGYGQQIINKPVFNIFQHENVALPVKGSGINQKKLKELIDEWRNQRLIMLTLFNNIDSCNLEIPYTYSKSKFQNFETKLLKNKSLLVYIGSYLYCLIENKLIWHMPFSQNIDGWYQNSKGEILIGLRNAGVRIYRKLEDIPRGKFETQLEAYTISHITEDRDGGYWYSALDGGVFYSPNSAIKIYNKNLGFPSDNATSIAIKSQNELYLGFLDKNIIHLNTETKKTQILKYGGDQVNDLFYATKQNKLWVGTTPFGYLQNQTWHQLIYSDTNYNRNILVAKSIRFFQSHNQLWLSNGHGFYKINPVSDSLEIHSHEIISQENIGNTRTLDILIRHSGQIWVANINGIFQLVNNEVLTPNIQHPAFYTRVEAMEELHDSTMVIGSKGYGLVFWKGDTISSITESNGLTSNMIEKLHVDNKGILWVGTLNGLNKVNWNWVNHHIETITTSHGLPTNEINDIASWNDDIWIATTKGLAHITHQEPNRVSKKPILASVLSNNHVINTDALNSLSYWENNLTINYFAINFKMNGRIPYRYRIDNAQWMKTFNSALNFPSLPPGSRSIEVQAQNEDGVWSESTILSFIINPPWWNTWWARTLYLLTALVGGFGIYNYNTRQLKQAHRIQLRITELERSALQAQMNPHFIFNCLNSIQNYILQNEKDAAIKYLGSFASLVRSMLNASVVGKISLEEEIKLLNNYLDLEKIRFKNRFIYEVKTAKGLDTFETMIPPLLVQPYVENAVKHGISGRESGGEIKVIFEKIDTSLQVSILDNGTGILPDHDKSEKQNSHKSFGMSITQNRLELLSNENINNTVRSKTLYDENNQISGTEVIIMIGLTEEVHSTKT